MSTPPALLRLYQGGARLLEPAAAVLLRRRARQGKEDPARLKERRGYPGRVRPPGDLVWVHGASMGETLSLLPVIEMLTRRGLPVLVTSGTRSSAETLGRRLPPGAFHQFVPLDVPRYVARFLAHWRPLLALFAESEIWPNTILELERQAIPLILVNGRMSERSGRRWAKLPALSQALLSRFSLCIAQSGADAERLSQLGAPRVVTSGNLKFDVAPPPADPRTVIALSGIVAGRPLWVAASTHPGEDEMVIAAHRHAAPRFPDLLTILAPRHPRRGAEIAALAAADGLRPGLRSEGALPETGIDVYVADTIGELGLFYRLSSLVFMGGSLVPHGGQNPIEPAKLGAAILHGPHVRNFAAVYAALDHAGAALAIGDGERLGRIAADLLADPGLMRAMARAGAETVEAFSGALERTLAAIEPFLPTRTGTA